MLWKAGPTGSFKLHWVSRPKFETDQWEDTWSVGDAASGQSGLGAHQRSRRIAFVHIFLTPEAYFQLKHT